MELLLLVSNTLFVEHVGEGSSSQILRKKYSEQIADSLVALKKIIFYVSKFKNVAH
jgi:hypothetical protein